MSTYNGWNIVTIPTFPPAPQSIEFEQFDIVADTTSPFTGQQQIQDWNANYMSLRVNLPVLIYANAQPWVAFFRSLKGKAGVFQFTAAFMAAYPNDLGSRYWRLKSNSRQWTVSKDRVYLISFECREAI
jgi:hypothetical protein